MSALIINQLERRLSDDDDSDSSCSTSCGIIGLFATLIFYGSFVAPIKFKASSNVHVDPLVFQTYKCFMCFIFSWPVLLFGVKFTFTSWGIISGLIWTPGGTAGIYAIRNLGITTSVSIWCCTTIIVSSFWGFCVFGEKAKSIWITALGYILLTIGVVGASRSSAPDDEEIESRSEEEVKETCLEIHKTDENGLKQKLLLNEITSDLKKDDEKSANELKEIDCIEIFGYEFSPRCVGITCAVANGCNGGSVLVPMLLSDIDGFDYVLSYSIGSLIANQIFWFLRFMYSAIRKKSFSEGYDSLPSFHLKDILIPGCLSGILYHIGHVGVILSVSAFGNAIGGGIGNIYILVSGMWGILFYKEVRDKKKIITWFVSAITLIAGVCLLAIEQEDD